MPMDRHSEHRFICTEDRGCLVLSRVQRVASWPPFALQFAVMDQLARRLRTVRLPVATLSGSRYVVDQDCYWFMRRFTASDPVQFSYRPEFVGNAARALAEIHTALGERRLNSQGLKAHRLALYHQPVRAFVARLEDTFEDFATTVAEIDDRDFVALIVKRLASEASAVLDAGRDLFGLAHHDYRPENLLVQGDRVIEIIDWDRAYEDLQLYDVAFGALQFGGRQGLWGSAMLSLATQFVDDYLRARNRLDLRGQVLGWWLPFVVVKRLLLGSLHAAERLNLLRRVCQLTD